MATNEQLGELKSVQPATALPTFCFEEKRANFDLLTSELPSDVKVALGHWVLQYGSAVEAMAKRGKDMIGPEAGESEISAETEATA